MGLSLAYANKFTTHFFYLITSDRPALRNCTKHTKDKNCRKCHVRGYNRDDHKGAFQRKIIQREIKSDLFDAVVSQSSSMDITAVQEAEKKFFSSPIVNMTCLVRSSVYCLQV